MSVDVRDLILRQPNAMGCNSLVYVIHIWVTAVSWEAIHAIARASQELAEELVQVSEQETGHMLVLRD